jgi:hypothetical protein
MGRGRKNPDCPGRQLKPERITAMRLLSNVPQQMLTDVQRPSLFKWIARVNFNLTVSPTRASRDFFFGFCGPPIGSTEWLQTGHKNKMVLLPLRRSR